MNNSKNTLLENLEEDIQKEIDILCHNINFLFYRKNNNGSIYHTDEQIRTIKCLGKLSVYNDHIPPHFHISQSDLRLDLKFKIDTLEQIDNSRKIINSKEKKFLHKWYFDEGGKEQVIALWDKMNRGKVFGK